MRASLTSIVNVISNNWTAFRSMMVLLVMLSAIIEPVYAQDDQADLAKQAQNPIANLISLPLQNNNNFGLGVDNATQNVLNIQPVVLTKLGDWPNGTSNVEQLKRAKEIINSVGRPVVTGAEAIKYLDIPYEATRR